MIFASIYYILSIWNLIIYRKNYSNICLFYPNIINHMYQWSSLITSICSVVNKVHCVDVNKLWKKFLRFVLYFIRVYVYNY